MRWLGRRCGKASRALRSRHVLPVCLLAGAEYCAGGSLYDVLSAARSNAELAAELTWRRRISMLLDAAAGLSYLNSRTPPIIHTDVRLSGV